LAESVAWPERATARVLNAMETALEHPRGPAFLRLPMDVAGVDIPAVEVYRTPQGNRVADPAVCARIARALQEASRPAIFLGVGARTAEVGAQVLRIAERARCPVICDIEAKGLFPESHSLSLGIH